MYTPREALAYNGKLPIQQNPTGVTPQLLDLLAMQKVDADKKAAAQALAISSGQANMPTVAQGIEQQALNSARGEIAQKLGLAGLAQQQAPQGPAPQMPPQQGLEGAPSPLPQSYQEGGIVAFAEAGQVPKADPEAETFVDSLGIERNTKTGDPVGPSLVQRFLSWRDKVNAPPSTREQSQYFNGPAPAAAPPPATSTAKANTATMPTDATRRGDIRFPPSGSLTPVSTPSYQREKAVGLADAAKANLAAVNPPAAVTADPNSFVEMERKRLTGLAALSPEDAYKKGDEEYQSRIGAGLDRDMANQQARIAKREELYARQAAERDPSWLTGLQRMGQNVHALPGQQFQGVSEQISKTNAGYTTQDIANQTAIDTLNEAMEKARQSKDIGAYTAAKGARDAIYARQAEGGKETAQMAGNEMQAATSKYTAELQASTSRAVAALQEQASDRRFTIQEQNAAQQRLIDTVRSIDADLKSLETEKKAYVGVVPTPENKTKMAELDTAIANARALKQQIMGSAYAKQGVTVPAAAPTMSSDRAKQFQVLR